MNKHVCVVCKKEFVAKKLVPVLGVTFAGRYMSYCRKHLKAITK